MALRVNTSTVFLRCLIFSLCLTPKRCSSSIINKPKSLYLNLSFNSLCVPTMISILPSSSFLQISVISFADLNLLTTSILIGKFANLLIKLS